MNGRKKITRDMIEAARDKGWNATQTSRHYGMHRKSIDAAAERFGIMLPLGMTWAPPPKPKHIVVWTDEIEDRPKVKLSAGPAAIEKALAKLAAEKKSRLQTTD
jgi:hypothetical protein